MLLKAETKMNVYELSVIPEVNLSQKDTQKRVFTQLPLPILMKYALWFCHLRWIVIGLLTIFGILGFFPDSIQFFGLHPQTSWAIVTAGMLIIINIAYLKHIMQMKRAETYDSIMNNIWAQVIIDLIILTGVIHYSGSLETFIPFTYLFHIVLACIFFSSKQSLIVTILAGILYVACVCVEKYGIIPSAGMYIDRSLRIQIENNVTITIINVMSSLGIWFIVWYLASYLSKMVLEREFELVKTNKRLLEIQREKTRHLLRITHELKSPFAAIDANIQLLLKGYCGVFPDKALKVLERISNRSKKLGQEIQEMLQLVNLHSVKKDTLCWKKLDLAEIIRWCMVQVLPLAEKRKIVFDKELEQAYVVAVEDHMKMLLVNLISNAVIYSYEKGRVRVYCRPSTETGPVITIKDRGIGIPGDKLPKIFDEYYKTDEAVRHNKNSTGLGLAIVKNVAQVHHINVRITSIPKEGTKFELVFPSSIKHVNKNKEKQNVLSHDY
ncbi:sensor histidine kinase [Candidatus Latescibacterota bacterium]